MYCTKCGRKLEEGEVCTCTQNTQTPHMRPEHMQKRPSFDGFSEKNIKDAEWKKEHRQPVLQRTFLSRYFRS